MPESNPAPRGQLTRDQLAEIIRANVAAFKDEPNFYDYLTELVIYLMEYEYAWHDKPTAEPDAAGLRELDTVKSTRYRFEFIQPVTLGLATGGPEPQKCRMCGADMHGKLVCPNCMARNRKQ